MFGDTTVIVSTLYLADRLCSPPPHILTLKSEFTSADFRLSEFYLCKEKTSPRRNESLSHRRCFGSIGASYVDFNCVLLHVGASDVCRDEVRWRLRDLQ